MNILLLKKKIESFLQEDLEFGDSSTQLFPHRQIKGYFIVKQAGIICGLQVIKATYQLLDSNVELSLLVKEGEKVTAGQKIAYVKGDATVLLSCERVILNLLQHMSGIASHTALMIKKLNDPTIKLVDTRKTTPGLRLFDKYAVKIGGGYNHRLSLSDGIMIKDNHIALANGVIPALQLAQKDAGPLTKIEIEVETLNELKEAIQEHADVIMFDNQTPQTIKKWVFN
ncbi:nicotinate-nucleotide pyrophosphorylase [Lactobacillus ultunensis DSM 16047]|uniref:Probable nicotinate-nucleotide pyrophosphorylase [carboxylating] n=1 Tax=Lactobacillus ultunensis DSM 16047 TaxID=525365 RepID=C2ELA1_9LACO|nr:carboxylating nicotinate-nucleotide diphosphorylase [Lactobacillus ultunensis]EEJ72683.1 quinolinate phosphoribosyl transferase, C-terminal domain protein [Lactobacillus ultunensis DSM 16047]KRL80578.1 nicotinate-nucleotide pyrophosphorylase [Lactobacillus ultunensis DSM 16047]